MVGSGHPILTLSMVLVAGILGGLAAKRFALPGMTGQIVFGAILGPSVIGLVNDDALHALRPMTLFALGLIAVAIGNHLNFRRLKKRFRGLLMLLLFEVTLTPILVVLAMRIGGIKDWSLAIMFAAMAVASTLR